MPGRCRTGYRSAAAVVPELTPRGDVKLNSGNRLHATLSPLGFSVAGHLPKSGMRGEVAGPSPHVRWLGGFVQGAFEMDKQKHDLIYQIATAGLVVAFFVLMLFLRR